LALFFPVSSLVFQLRSFFYISFFTLLVQRVADNVQNSGVFAMTRQEMSTTRNKGYAQILQGEGFRPDCIISLLHVQKGHRSSINVENKASAIQFVKSLLPASLETRMECQRNPISDSFMFRLGFKDKMERDRAYSLLSAVPESWRIIQHNPKTTVDSVTYSVGNEFLCFVSLH
jgi:hypothetical protein